MLCIAEKLSLGRWSSLSVLEKFFVFLFFVFALSVYLGFVEGLTRFQHDMSESYAWGKEFQWGYHQHPPYFAWLAGAWFLFFPHELWSYGILSSLNATIGLIGSVLLISEFEQGARRNVAIALLILMPNFSFEAFKWAANIPFLALCPWTMLFFVRSIRQQSLANSLLFGVLSGLSLLNKYFAILYLACCFLVAVTHPNARRYFLSILPYTSILIAFFVFLPHFQWLLQHRDVEGATPLHYFTSIIGRDFLDNLADTGRALGELLQTSILPVFLILIATMYLSTKTWAFFNKRNLVLNPLLLKPEFFILAFGPIALTLLSSLLFQTRLTAEMFYGIMPLFPLVVVSLISDEWIEKIHKPLFRLAALFPFILIPLAPIVSYLSIAATATSADITPTKEIALKALDIWKQDTGLPLRLVGGSNYLENVTVFYSNEPEAHSFIRMDRSHSLWVQEGDVEKKGLLVVCEANDQDCNERGNKLTTPKSKLHEVSVSHYAWGKYGRPYEFTIRVIPPT